MSWLFPKQQVLPAVAMPDSQSPGVLEAARQRFAAIGKRGGRASTILTGGSAAPTAGTTPAYSNVTMGGAS